MAEHESDNIYCPCDECQALMEADFDALNSDDDDN